jgi:hypothetical protein
MDVGHGERGAQERGRWVHIEKGLQVKGIRIQWDRSQIRVREGPKMFFFYSYGVVLQSE